MCMDYSKTCKCGRGSASFNFKDNVMPTEVISRLYCPACSGDIKFDPYTMLKDNGWVIEYDIDVARMMKEKLPAANLSPEFLFDQGYCTWRGIYPGDHIDSVGEREEIVQLAKVDQKKYLDELRQWGTKRMLRLSREGWRKANEGN